MDAVPVRCMCGVISRSVKDMWARTDGRTDADGCWSLFLPNLFRFAGGGGSCDGLRPQP